MKPRTKLNFIWSTYCASETYAEALVDVYMDLGAKNPLSGVSFCYIDINYSRDTMTMAMGTIERGKWTRGSLNLFKYLLQ